MTALVEDETLIYQRDGEYHQLQVGTPAWYAWLETATLFRVRGPFGTFTVRKEQAGNQHGKWYWRAYRKRAGTLYRVYLGATEKVTLEQLRSIAAHFFTSPPPAREEIDSEQIATSSLPLPLTSLIGRERELTTVRALLVHPEVRVITLTGTGGVGKTRLALGIATEIRESFPDGICFISLASIRNTDLVLPAIVQALGLQGRNRPPLEVLQSELLEQALLLILDNFEQVVAVAPRLVDLLATCPRLKLLITSREVLRIRGEHEFVVQPLSLPASKQQPDNETLTHYGAVALFLERAREFQPAFELTTLNAPLITEICRRLDGLPLALELAAARLKVLSPQALLERLEHRLAVLTGGARDLPPRQQTLRQTIAWSYDLLSPEEQHLFRLLAVFVNGCTLEAAEAVYSKLGGYRAQVLDEVTSLLDKHLLYQGEQGEQTPRLLLHETVREFGLEALATNQELEMAQQVHAEYYLGLTEAHLEGIQLTVWLEQLEREYANLHTALQWVLDRPTSKMASGLEHALVHFWEGHQRLSADKIFPTHSLTSSQDGPARTRTPFTSGDPAQVQDNSEHGAVSDLEAVSSQISPGSANHLAQSFYLLGIIAWIIGDIAMAGLYTEKGLARAKGSNEKVTLAYLFDLLGQIALDQGEDIKACSLLEEGLTLHRETGDILGSLNALFFLERVLCVLGEATRARVYAEEHLKLSKEIGYWPGIIGTLIFLARLALEAGNMATAGELLKESLALLREPNENRPLTVATNLQGLGVTLAALGRLTEAVQLWGAADALSTLLPEERAFVARASMAIRATLSEVAFTAAWATGQAMTLEQALDTMEHLVPTDQPAAQTSRTHQHLPGLHALTTREEEVLRLVARGLTDAQIAETLIISPRTVNAHLRSIYMKLDISSRNAATYIALEHHLL